MGSNMHPVAEIRFEQAGLFIEKLHEKNQKPFPQKQAAHTNSL
jgi:hypothetical protein